MTYADDKDTLKCVYQLLDTLQRNNFKTSADQKQKSDMDNLTEKIQNRYIRVSCGTVYLSRAVKSTQEGLLV